MIIDKNMIMTWNSNNKKYYIDKGYIFTKMFDEFDIKIEDLNPGSCKKIKVMCDVCENIKMLSYNEYLRSVHNGDYYACSTKCSHDKSKNTCFKNYGVEFPSQAKQNQDKTKNTNIKRYGFERPSQSDEIKNKIKLSHNNFDEDKKNKILEKQKKTCLEKYGDENYNNTIKNKETCLEKYGVENVFELIEIKEKIKNTNLKKYGFDHHTKNKQIMNKITETQIEKYGETWKNKVPKYNPNSIIYLDMISEKLNIIIQHALNGGEKKIIKYWIDGYIEQYNICIEWDEKGHKYKQEYDKNREKYLKLNINCEFVRINEKEFLKNIENGINTTIEKINNIINKKSK